VGADGVRDELVDLPSPEGDDAEVAALLLLRERSLSPLRIVAVHPYAVTYLDKASRLRTAWLLYEDLPEGGGRLRVWPEPLVKGEPNRLPAFTEKPPPL